MRLSSAGNRSDLMVAEWTRMDPYFFFFCLTFRGSHPNSIPERSGLVCLVPTLMLNLVGTRSSFFLLLISQIRFDVRSVFTHRPTSRTLAADGI
jgi:hypothetical protein